MGRALKIALIFIGIPAIILAAIFFPNVPWSDIAIVPVVWITGSTSAVPAGDYKRSIPLLQTAPTYL